jgi:ethanolamine ammonia-lyase large subunit
MPACAVHALHDANMPHFIGPEYWYDGKQIIRAGLEDQMRTRAEQSAGD